MKRDQVTIKDIARELGVSVSTVSRALSNNPLVKSETRQAIQDLAKARNYHPNFTALSLRQQKTKTLGLLIPQVVHEFFAHVIRGIEDIAYDRGYNVLISTSNESYEREKKNALELLNGRVDGLLACITKETEDLGHLYEFKNRDVPLVLFDCVSDQIETDKIIIDDERAGYRATSHLIEKGCKTLGFVGGPDTLLINQKRFAGYKKAMKEADIPIHHELIFHGKSGKYKEGLDLTRSLFEQNLMPDGVFATTDMLAIGVMSNAFKKGIAIPEDLAVIGFSNWEIGEIFNPTLSTIDQRSYDIGKAAIEMLLRRIESDENIPFETITIDTRLIERESTNR